VPLVGQLDGKVALITGAASGIGKATAELLASEGARICVVDLTDDEGHRVADGLGGLFVPADMGDAKAVDNAFETCVAELGSVDIAFLNAGIAIGHAELETLTDDVYERIMRVNVDGVVYGARAAIRAMERGNGGAIVATSSLAGLIPFPPDPVYALTKHAVVGLIRSIAPTVAPKGITANTVNPGITDTNILSSDAKQMLGDAGFPIMPASQIAAAVLRIVTSGRTGECWVCQPGRAPEPYGFHNVPGPRTEGDKGKIPPGVREGSFPAG
jgi:NAD(P)-dependent dehydrogenase (short-subunit alcohol dehydrogenase family)